MVKLPKILQQTKLIRKEMQNQEVIIEAIEDIEVIEVKVVHIMETKILNNLQRIHRVKYLRITDNQEVQENIRMLNEKVNL